MAMYDVITQRAQITEAEIQNRILDAQLKEQQLRAIQQAKMASDIEEMKKSSWAKTDSQKKALIKEATMAGEDVSGLGAFSEAQSSPSFGDQALAFGGGVADSLLFGILKDSWYSDDSTKSTATAGKWAGTIASIAASLLIPGMQGKAVAQILNNSGKVSKTGKILLGTKKMAAIRKLAEAGGDDVVKAFAGKSSVSIDSLKSIVGKKIAGLTDDAAYAGEMIKGIKPEAITKANIPVKKSLQKLANTKLKQATAYNSDELLAKAMNYEKKIEFIKKQTSASELVDALSSVAKSKAAKSEWATVLKEIKKESKVIEQALANTDLSPDTATKILSLLGKRGAPGIKSIMTQAKGGKNIMSTLGGAINTAKTGGEYGSGLNALYQMAGTIQPVVGSYMATLETSKPWSERKSSPYYIDPTWADMMQLQGMGR